MELFVNCGDIAMQCPDMFRVPDKKYGSDAPPDIVPMACAPSLLRTISRGDEFAGASWFAVPIVSRNGNVSMRFVYSLDYYQ